MSGTMNTVANSTQTDQDPLSPTTLILNYLRSQGMPPNAENVRRAVMANARESNAPGADPVAGLRSARPSSEAEDQAAMKAAGAGRGGKAAPAKGVSRGPMDRRDEPQTTSAAPGASPTQVERMQMPALEAARGGVPEIPQPPIPRAPPTAQAPVVPEVAPASAPSVLPEVVMEKAMQLGGPERPLALTDQRVPMQQPPEVITPEAPAAASPKFTMPEVPNVVGQAGQAPQQPDPMVEFRRTGRGLTVQPSALTRVPAAAMAGYKVGKIPGAIAGAASELLPSNLPRPDEIASRILRGFSQP